MHIATSFLSTPVAAGFGAVAVGAVSAAIVRSRKVLDEQTVPVVGVLGAFVFAAQMVNFTIPPATSGHLAGGFLLGVICGWAPAMIIMAAILIIQALVFADGGLDALGANIFNMGVLPCLLGGIVHVVWRRNGLRWAAPMAAVGAWLAVVLGAVLVVVQFWLSGRLGTSTLLTQFATAMVGVHALIGIVEGVVTTLVLAYISRTEIGLQMRAKGVTA